MRMKPVPPVCPDGIPVAHRLIVTTAKEYAEYPGDDVGRKMSKRKLRE